MDLSFERYDTGKRRNAARGLDYIRLLSSIAAAQAGSRTAATEARLGIRRMPADSPVAALTRLFDPGFGWASAVAALGGSFHPALARGRMAAGDEA
jgi:hypothetical protein